MHECKALLMEIIRHLKLNNLERRKKLMELGKRIKHYRNEKLQHRIILHKEYMFQDKLFQIGKMIRATQILIVLFC